ncbi:MAG TPA: hypothetical protein VN256_13245 [Pyrinomonadaceae bacterium]|nr:hypothetical protein [Pyrinomonadaceae bacterium]
MIRRLDPDKDQELIREALSWVNEQPRFFQDADKAFGNGDVGFYLELMRTEPQADFGIFDGGLVAMITISLVGKGMFDSHLLVKRGTRPELIVPAAYAVLRRLFEMGLKEGWSWPAAKNTGVRKVLEMIGMRRDGLTKYKGQSHGKPILWMRYSVRAA